MKIQNIWGKMNKKIFYNNNVCRLWKFMYNAVVNSNTHNISFWGKFILSTYLQIIHYMCMVRLPNAYTDKYTAYWCMFFIISTSTVIIILHLSDKISKHCNVIIYQILNTWRKMHAIFVKYSLSTSIQNCTWKFWMFIIHSHYNPLNSMQVHLQQQLLPIGEYGWMHTAWYFTLKHCMDLQAGLAYLFRKWLLQFFQNFMHSPTNAGTHSKQLEWTTCMSISLIGVTSLLYHVLWSCNWRRSSMGGWAPYSSFRGMFTSSTNNMNCLPSGGPYTPATRRTYYKNLYST